MRKVLILFVFLIVIQNLFAQTSDDSYRSTNNPLYWKNRMPDAAYWQQDVHYDIKASIDEIENKINGNEVLEYWNNSPDTLQEIYFHLYQNAFVKGSYLHGLEKEVHQKVRLGKREMEGLGILIESLKVNGEAVKTELDNTILKVKLNKPMPPNSKITFNMEFKTWWDFGSSRRRMQAYKAWDFMHYNGVQWFPKICVYDRKFGWDTYQHLNKEFYGDFGSFDVALNFPDNYIVEATGVLQNREEVLPQALREKLDVKNFAQKKWNEKPSTIIAYKKENRKTWKFHADNVHDFAFTADPSYRISTAYWKGIECVGLVQEPHASGWQNSGTLVAKIVQTFSEGIGLYQYPKMVAADANDGMEYPMLTLDGGKSPTYDGLLVHEIGHNWFYGQVGNNETYRAALDEGFTQFLTGYGLQKIDGNTQIEDAVKPSLKNRFKKKFKAPINTLDRNVFNAYITDALQGNETPINTHSNDFNDAIGHEGGYRQVYYKTASMLYNLQYVLGNELFEKAMQNYFKQWRFAHPYFEDFRNSFIQFTKVDLNWFFDEWMETTKTIDYQIKRIKKVKGERNYAVKFKRKGLMQMPIDFTVTDKKNQTQSYHIPNTWFIKNTTAIVLPKWYGWSKINPTYIAQIHAPQGIRKVQIDTTYRLADINNMDNFKRKGLPATWSHTQIKLDGGLNPSFTNRKNYVKYYRPDLWWNPIDGIKAGIHVEGDYLNTLHQADATIWWNTHVLQAKPYLSFKSQKWYAKYAPINYFINYSTPISLKYPKLKLNLNSRYLDGLLLNRGGFSWQINGNNLVKIYAQSLLRPKNFDTDYLIHTSEWSSLVGKPNSSLNMEWQKTYLSQNSNGLLTVNLRSPFLTPAFNYSYAQLCLINFRKLGKADLRLRLFGRYGTGNEMPNESSLYMAGANPEEMMENKYTRSIGFVSDDWRGFSPYDMSHFQQGGGLNLRGYAGYFVADERNGNILIGYKGQSGAAINVELDLQNYFHFAPQLTKNWLHSDVYLFADAGMIQLNDFNPMKFSETTPSHYWSDVRVDAGLGIAMTIKKFGIFEKAKPLTLRLDMPFFVNRTPYANPQYFTWRWMVGVNRSF